MFYFCFVVRIHLQCLHQYRTICSRYPISLMLRAINFRFRSSYITGARSVGTSFISSFPSFCSNFNPHGYIYTSISTPIKCTFVNTCTYSNIKCFVIVIKKQLGSKAIHCISVRPSWFTQHYLICIASVNIYFIISQIIQRFMKLGIGNFLY